VTNSVASLTIVILCPPKLNSAAILCPLPSYSELPVSADLNELSSVLTVQFERLVMELKRGKEGTMDNFRTA
jgi:hypothetical protein